ncbi:MAG TPA: S8 family serine peptidase, partial [Chloroflexota bacterium]
MGGRGWLRPTTSAGLAVVVITAMAATGLSGLSSEAAGQTAPVRAPSAISERSFPTVLLSDGREARADRILVGFKPNVGAAERSQVAGNTAQEIGGRAVAITIPTTSSVDAAVQTYRNDPRVAYAEPDRVLHALDIPNDPFISIQWAPNRIQAPAAWSVTHGSPTIKIAVLDCGIYEAGSTTRGPGHPDVNGKVDARRDFTGSSSGADDRCDHGTHVAGIAAAQTNNGIGIAAIGFDSHLLNGKVLDDSGTGTDSWVTSGIIWAADNGARVINMSLGAPGACSTTLQDAVDYAWSRNTVLVAAAGNAGTSTPVAPADCNHVVAVAATDWNDGRASFSSYGSWVALAAPGVSILSTNWVGEYEVLSGTSMAAPQVSGLAGLVWASGLASTAQDVVNRMTAGADSIYGTGTYWQYGRINAAATLGAPPSTPTPTLAPSNLRGWGGNNWGALTQPVATQVVKLPTSLQGPGVLTAVAAGQGFNLGLKADGTVWAWGIDQHAELAAVMPSCDPAPYRVVLCSTRPVQVPGVSGAVAIAASSAALVLRNDGTVWTWGGVDLGQPCPDPFQSPCVPAARQVAGLSGITAVAAGGTYLALHNDGTLFAWGWNQSGQLGDGTTTDRWTPAPVQGLSNVRAIASGGSFNLAALLDGTVWGWGSDSGFQLGQGWPRTDPTCPPYGSECRPVPVRVPGPTSVTAVAAGGAHGMALQADGTVWSWGSPGRGSIGDGTYNTAMSPVHLTTLSSITALSLGNDHSLALDRDGNVWGWGDSTWFAAGNACADHLVPTRVDGPGTISISASSAQNGYSLAIAAATVTLTPTPTATATPPPPGSTPTFTPTAIAAQANQSVAFQNNVAHNGAVRLADFAAPLIQRWSATFTSTGYPMIANGRVFVIGQDGCSTQLYALDARNGQTIWHSQPVGGENGWAAAAYDAGRIFVLNSDGLLRGFDALSGSLLWTSDLGTGSSYDAPPTAAQGLVFVPDTAFALLRAFDERTGALVWTYGDYYASGDFSAPTLSDDGVYIAQSGPNVWEFDRSTGDERWHHFDGYGGGGWTAVYNNGRLYVRQFGANPSGFVLDAATGLTIGRFGTGAYQLSAPAIQDGRLFFVEGAILHAQDLATGTPLWTFAGDSQLISNPLVVNQQVFAGSSSGNLYAVDAATGAQVWSTNLGGGVPFPDLSNAAALTTGFGAGEGLLVTPVYGRLVAFETGGSGSPPTATPTRTPTATPTSTASATRTATPSPTLTPTVSVGMQTITFDDLTSPNRVLNGQYPSGVIDWGSNAWYLSSPWRQFTTNSIGFNGPVPTSGSFTFVSPRRLVQLDAFNGGSGASTVTLSCAGQPTVSVVLAANELRTLSTGWSSACTSVTITSSNGWNTNFDSLELAASSGPPPGTVTPTPTPWPTLTPTPTPTVSIGTQTITFDDLTSPNRVLNGQYPSGVIDWGSNAWYLSSPWRQFTTN